MSDPGLQPERTELAWRRTLLAIAAGALVSVRVLPGTLGGWTIATGFAGVAAAAVLWVAASRRHRLRASAFAGAGGCGWGWGCGWRRWGSRGRR